MVARGIQAIQRSLRLLDHLAGEVDRAAILRAEHEHAHRFQIKFLGDVAHGEEVAQRLAHLLVIHIDESVVHPVMDERLARRALALGDLVFVVREDEILAAAVDIQRLAEVFHAHRRAFDMPARTAHPPRRFPRRLARLLRFPDGEIHRMALVRVNVDARAALQILKVLAAELAVAGERLRIVVNVAVVAGIGQALVDQLLNQRDDIRDMLGRARIDRRALDAQRIRVGVIFLDEADRPAP